MTFDLMIGSVLLVHCEIIIIKSLRNDWIHQHGLCNYESIDHRTSTLRLKLAMPVSIRRWPQIKKYLLEFVFRIAR